MSDVDPMVNAWEKGHLRQFAITSKVDSAMHKQVRKNMQNYNTNAEAAMSAEQNAHVIVNAEQYYHAMV